jgi:uncharacterized protein YdhG (YjbR/CyaY superfamily)
MKKSKSGKSPRTVAEYLAAVPEPARTALKKVRATIRSTAPPDATESISYGIPMFKYKGMLMGFGAFSNHCSLFPGAGVTIDFKEDLKDFPTSKGTIRFAPNKPFPASLLRAMIKARVAKNNKLQKPRRPGTSRP